MKRPKDQEEERRQSQDGGNGTESIIFGQGQLAGDLVGASCFQSRAAVTLVTVDVLPCTQAIAQEIYADLVEDSCLGFCFEVHRAVKCGYFFLDDTDPDSMKDFGELQGWRRAVWPCPGRAWRLLLGKHLQV